MGKSDALEISRALRSPPIRLSVSVSASQKRGECENLSNVPWTSLPESDYAIHLFWNAPAAAARHCNGSLKRCSSASQILSTWRWASVSVSVSVPVKVAVTRYATISDHPSYDQTVAGRSGSDAIYFETK